MSLGAKVLRHFKVHPVLNIDARNGVFATNLNFLIPISLQSDGENLLYIKTRLSI